MQYTLFVFLAPVAAVVMAVTLVHAFFRRRTPGAVGLIFYLGVVAGYLVTNTLELADPTPAGTLFWAKFSYFFITSIPVTWLAFSLEYTGGWKWLRPGRFWVFGVIPLVTFALALTTEANHLIWTRYNFVPVAGYLAIHVEHGPWFWVDGIYNYTIMLVGALVMFREHFLSPAPGIYRRRTALLIAGGIFPLVFNLMYVFHVVRGWEKDYSPLAFALAGLFFAVVLFRYRLLEVAPVARSLLVEEMPDGMLMIDARRRVVDYNPAARGILGITGDPIGKRLEEVWPQSGDYLAFQDETAVDSLTRPDVMYLQRGNLRMAFSLRVMPVGERRHRRGSGRSATGHNNDHGWLILLTEVTRRVEAERGMMEANTALRHLNEDLEARIQRRTAALRSRAAELEALSRVSVALRRAVGMDELLHILLKEAIANVQARAGAIFVVEGEDLVLRAVEGVDTSAVGVGLGQAHPRAARPAVIRMEDGPAGSEGASRLNALRAVVETGQILHRDRLPEVVSRMGVGEARLDGPVMVIPIRAGGQSASAAAATAPVEQAEEQVAAQENLAAEKLAAAPKEQAAPEKLAAENLADRSAATDRPSTPARVLGLMVVCFEEAAARTALSPAGKGEDAIEPDAERLLTAIAEVGSNAFQRVRAMENLEQLVQLRTRHLSTLYEITTVTNQFMELPELLDGVLRTIQTVLGLRAVTLHVENYVDDAVDQALKTPDQRHHPEMVLAAWVGLDQTAVDQLPTVDTPWGQVMARGAMVVQQQMAQPVRSDAAPEKAAPVLRACIGVPVRAKGRLLGVLTVLDESIGHFSAEDLALLGAIADQVGVAVESAQLRERARQKAEEAAVMEERQRLARDLHDSVTQSLYSVVLFSEAVRDGMKDINLTPPAPDSSRSELPPLRREGGPEELAAPIELAMENLEHLREAGQQALKEMRLMIYELRPQSLARDGLVGALRNRLEMVERRAGVTARLEVNGLFPLPDAVEMGLFGIAQEALNNVLKHARATQVLVRLCPPEPGCTTAITLEVRDNGVGFPPDVLDGGGNGGVGLSSMRERARQMGGVLEITSEEGQGTRVAVTVEGIEAA